MVARHSRTRTRQAAIALLMAAVGCVGVRYQRPGQQVTPRAGQSLVFGRVRFFHDDREFFPWKATLLSSAATERHLWLLRLGRRAVSAEVHPDADGSLAIWLAEGDYALLGSTQPVSTTPAGFEVVALLRVPAGAAASYAGELAFRTASHEHGYLARGEFGAASVEYQPAAEARAVLEQRFGVLPGPPALSPWCAGDSLPGFTDPRLAQRAKDLLDGGCLDKRLPPVSFGGAAPNPRFTRFRGGHTTGMNRQREIM